MTGQTLNKNDYSQLLQKFNNYNLIITYKNSGGEYTLLDNYQVSLESNLETTKTWHLVKDSEKGILELRFNEAISANSFKIHVLIDERVPSLQTDAIPDIRAIREHINKTQVEFASMIGVSVATLRNWEQGRRRPEGPALALLKIVSKNPEYVEQILTV